MPSPIVHFQLASADPEKTRAFLEEVLGWKFAAGSGRVVANIDTGAAQVVPNDIHVGGSLFQLPAGAPAYTAVFVRVADLDATLSKAVERGAGVVVPRTDIPGGPTVAIFATPDGAPMGLVQL